MADLNATYEPGAEGAAGTAICEAIGNCSVAQPLVSSSIALRPQASWLGTGRPPTTSPPHATSWHAPGPAARRAP